MEQFKRELKLMGDKEVEAKALIEETISDDYHIHCFEQLAIAVKDQCSASIVKLAAIMKEEVKQIVALQMDAESLGLELSGDESVEELSTLIDAKNLELQNSVIEEESESTPVN